jgi:hypothetical protein
MANRFWVSPINADWDGTAGVKWSTTSGGLGGAAIPTSSDDVFFDSNSSGVCTIATGNTGCLSLDTTGFTGTLAGSDSITVSGGMTLGSGMTRTYTGQITFDGTGSNIITTNGIVLDNVVVLDTTTGTITLGSDLDLGTTTSKFIRLDSGTFTANNFNITLPVFASSNSNTRTLNMGSGTWTFSRSFTSLCMDFAVSTNLTINAGTSLIRVIDSTANDNFFDGGGKTFYNIWWDRGSNTNRNVFFGHSATFNEIKDTGTAAHTMALTAGITVTTNSFLVSGTVGNVISINTATGTSTHNLVKTGTGVVNSNYLNIQHSVATPANKWYAGRNSTNNQGVATTGSGWIFNIPGSGAFFQFM